MRRIVTLLIAAMAFIAVVAQVETPSRGPIARVEPEEMHFTCLVGETVVDTFYVYNLSTSSVYPVSGFNSDYGYIWTESIHGTIPPGGVAKGVVTYTPEQEGTHHASLSMNIGGEFYGVEFYGVATVPQPLECTATPAINGTVINGGAGYMVEIINTDSEGTVIYYQVSERHDDEWENIGDWMTYDEPLTFTRHGSYRVEAYACAPGKNPSTSICFEFVVVEVYDCYDFEEDDIYYNIIDNSTVSVTAKTTYYNSYFGQVTIPNTVTHDGVTYMVTAIGDKAFYNCDELMEVIVGDYVTSVGKNAFWNCYRMTSIVLGDYVTTVGDEAFRYCTSLESVTLGKGIRSLGHDAFGRCPAITDVTCRAAIPPVMADEATFDSSVYASATLHVYPPVARNYADDYYWSNFGSIIGEDAAVPDAHDVNGDGRVDITDVVNLIDALLNN